MDSDPGSCFRDRCCIPELVGSLRHPQLRDTEAEGGENSSGSGVRGDNTACRQEQRLRDVPLDHNVGGPGTERSRVGLGADRHDQSDVEVADTGERSAKGVVVIEDGAEREVHEWRIATARESGRKLFAGDRIERDGSKQLSAADVITAWALQRRWVDVEVKVVIATSVWSRFQA